MLFFRWRSLPYGAEAHWNGLLGHDERNTGRLDEAKRLGDEIQRLATTLLGTRCAADAAILYDYDNESHALIENATGQHRETSEREVYRALSERHLTTDVRALGSVRGGDGGDLAGCRIIFFPHAHILTANDLAPLRAYVEAGGTLVFGCWSAYRDRRHWCYDAAGKAFFEELTGVRMADFTFIPEGATSTLRFGGAEGRPLDAPVFNEVLAPVAAGANVEVLATYAEDYYAGQPAVTLHRVGQGRVVSTGCFFTAEIVAALLDALGVGDPLAGWAQVPAEVHTVVRSDGGAQRFCFLLNFTGQPQTVTFAGKVSDLLAEQTLTGAVELPPYGVSFVRGYA